VFESPNLLAPKNRLMVILITSVISWNKNYSYRYEGINMTYIDITKIELSHDRLEKLLEQRLGNLDNKKLVAEIDQRIWDLYGEEWCVLFTDLAGFSKQAKDYGIIHFLQTIKESEKMFSPIIEKYDGFVVKSEGDSLIVIFRSPKKAIKCVVEMQYTSQKYNVDRAEVDQIHLCTGMGWGKILRIPGETVDVFGEEVNFAAKLGEDTAKSGEILITERLAQNFPEVEQIDLVEFGSINSGKQKVFKAIY